ncbi:hypothetical protein AaE_013980 [Aphanomyces astaci]|uniref:Helitron helicase-like domain-containing protein n=1 Tax=Aphanomyces astaci TaxID=112090 RepID=A0A6A4Z5F7_APHAT|nr:hypothetical protein AaE_013980 [Aphanomyces astaci]
MASTAVSKRFESQALRVGRRSQFNRDVLEYKRLFYDKGFLDASRRINLLFAFTSVGANEVPLTAGPPTYKIRGQLVHRLGSYRPKANLPPNFAQVYVLDSTDQVGLRSTRANEMAFTALERNAMKGIQAFMTRHNHFARTLYSVKERMEQLSNRTDDYVDDQICVAIRPRVGRNSGTHNAPTVPEMAICMRHEVGTVGRDIIVMPRRSEIQSVSEVSSAYDPLQYPLLFPFGEGGWDFKMNEDPQNPRFKRLSLLSYTKFKIYQRHAFSPLHMSGKLGQLYWTDQCCKDETNSLRWFTEHQSKVRADMYQNVQDAIAGDYTFDPTTMGQRVILPASHTGSDRYMSKLFQNSMAIVRKFGKPSLFITFTCNPQWEELTRALAFFQRYSGLEHPIPGHYRSDITCRVFQMKLGCFRADIMSGVYFGPVEYCFKVVEFQKRGLPHAHILVRLKSQIEAASEIDGFVSAELSNPVTQPRLHAVVLKHNIHSCSAHCLVNGKCSKKFPKSHCDSTSTDDDGYPCYRRRDTDPRNAYIVPHNQVMSLRYDCHINVEVCSTIASVKYMYKYVYKGGDKADVAVTCGDEVTNYSSMRYVSYTEACWHNLGFQCQWSSHSTRDENPTLKYPDVVYHYVWHRKLRQWKPRLRMTIIS